jgi:hypothetical protein
VSKIGAEEAAIVMPSVSQRRRLAAAPALIGIMPAMTTPKLPGVGSVPVDALGRFDGDVPCIRCHYNLRGCDANGRCPECGLAAGRSAYGHWLRYCEPTWVAKVWAGYNFFAAIPIGAGVFFAVLWLIHQAPVAALHSDVIDLVLPLAVSCTAVVVGLFGIWRIGTPDPAKVEYEGTMSLRRVTRVSPFIVVLGYIGGGVLGQALQTLLSSWPPYRRELLVEVIFRGIVLWLLILPVLTLWYGRRLANRVPAPKLARASWVVIVLIVTGAVGAMVVGFAWQHWQDEIVLRYFMLTHPGTTAAAAQNILGNSPQGWQVWDQLNSWYNWVMFSLSGLLILGLLAMSGVFIGYWRVMRVQAKLAKESWAKTPSSS